MCGFMVRTKGASHGHSRNVYGRHDRDFDRWPSGVQEEPVARDGGVQFRFSICLREWLIATRIGGER